MQLVEPLEWINKRLLDEYGSHDLSRPYWRVVFSEDQFEKRYGTFTDIVNGIFVREVTEIREVPKYRQWIQQKYLLERLIAIPMINRVEMLEEQLSYEPVWVFEDAQGNYLPPLFRAAKFVIERVYQQAAKSVGAKYKDPDSDPKEAAENYKKRIDGVVSELFGNETAIGDGLKEDHAVGYGVRKRNDSV